MTCAFSAIRFRIFNEPFDAGPYRQALCGWHRSAVRFELRGEARRICSLLGPSGCGKSTALRLIAGLLTPDRGEIRWSGGRPQMGFVFQEPTLMPWADALANARLPLDLKHLARGEGDALSAAALARLGLKGFESALPANCRAG